MKRHAHLLSLGLMVLVASLSWWLSDPEREPLKRTSGAGDALDAWAFARAFPADNFDMGSYTRAYAQHTSPVNTRNDEAEWTAMGPLNIGGRTLCLGFNPQNNQSILAGSASGGLWKSVSGGQGSSAWQRIETGFPLLGVGAIAWHPADSNIIYIGTGEVYNYQNTMPGVVDRTTRGTYGIGILKTIDGGQTWTKSLDWSYGDLRGVADMAFNPLRPETVFAATSEGLYRSRDAGTSWELVSDVLMTSDVEIHPTDSNIVYVAHGNFGSNGAGIYRSSNGGDSFSLTNAPSGYTGKTLMQICPNDPSIIYASIANTFDGVGFYEANTNGSGSWTQLSNQNIPTFQGWFSHDIAIDPTNCDLIVYSGQNTWRSTNGGLSFLEKGFWNLWFFGITPIGGPEGPSNYVHADVHNIYFHPDNADWVFLATDGGIFFSGDKGDSYEGRNGGYQTQQFYANFGNSQTDSSLAIGGMQDNATAIYLGDGAWKRVIGGDGMSAAINSKNGMFYGSYQRLGFGYSFDQGDNWTFNLPPGSAAQTSFAGPYEIAPATPDTLYAGRNYLYWSVDRGISWNQRSLAPLDNLNPILTIAVAPNNSQTLYASTAPRLGNDAKVFKSIDGGINWALVSNDLPNRLAMDIAIDPVDEDIAYAVFSGFGSGHVYKTIDGGINWQLMDVGLPDVPTNTVVIDPTYPDVVYIGNDLGIYVSQNGGLSWENFSEGLPSSTLIMHLSISAANQKLRAATHGNGVYQTGLLVPLPTNIASDELPQEIMGMPYPNPASEVMRLPLQIDQTRSVQLVLTDLMGRKIKEIMPQQMISGQREVEIELSDLAAGTYLIRLISRNEQGQSAILSRKIVVQ
ncbi:MAG: T9SS type A sorting domain-containing protein [Bacteroidota bacterium]